MSPRVPIQKVKRYKLKGRYSHNKNFGALAVFPPTLGRRTQYVKDQGYTSYCTAAARSAAASYFFGHEMSFEFMTAKEGQVAGKPIKDGTDPNTADTAGMEYGFLLDVKSPLRFSTHGWDKPADWRNYPKELDAEAATKTAVPFNVYPDYQSIKAALVSGASENAVVIANGFWWESFNESGAILPTPTSTPLTRHSYMFIDYKTINDKEYLVAQLSQGWDFGDNAVFYMSEECVNTAFRNPTWNGLGCEMYREGVPNPVLTKISLFQQLISALGQIVLLLRGL